jgi:gliding motility-associated-like protein
MRTLYKLVFTLCFGLYAPGAVAQYEGNIWYFGHGAGIDFNSGYAVSLDDGELFTDEGCATICDRQGTLLFYTDGITVYNRRHDVMPNGVDLMGDPSSTQSGIIVPWPGVFDRYYIFTVTEHGNENGLRYSVVDMMLDNGLGDIVPGRKNNLLLTPTSERIAAVRHKDLHSYWIATRGVQGNIFYAWRLTKAGLSSSPVISEVGSMHNGNVDGTVGYLKFSQTGAKAAYASRDKKTGFVELFDFDNETGKFSNAVTLPLPAAYGLEFAPNEQYLYVSQLELHSLVQYDISLKDQGLIRGSRKQVKIHDSNPAALQLGPDEKIYVTEPDLHFLHVISSPDREAGACDYQKQAVYLKKGYGRLGLPCLMSDIYAPPEMNSRFTCYNDLTEIYLGLGYKARKVILDFGDGTDTVFEGFGGKTIYHRYKSIGMYNLQLIYTRAHFTDTLATQIVIYPRPVVTVKDTEYICFGGMLKLSPSVQNAERWQWQNGDTAQALVVTDSGVYTFHAYHGTCHVTATINVIYRPQIELELGTDTSFCQHSYLVLSAGEKAGAHYLWSNGSTQNTITVFDSGFYSVIKKNECRSLSDTIHVAIKDCSCPVYIPDIFSPNKDLVNDGWKPMTLCKMPAYDLVIYNRFGEIVFRTKSLDSSWDGTFKGTLVQEGIYLYLLSAKSEYGSCIYRNGLVTVVR